MLSQGFRIHLQEILDFLGSVVVKFNYFEQMMNEGVEIDENDPMTFPYYRTLSGDHTVISTPIYVFSPVDGSDDNILTKEYLSDNPRVPLFYKANPDAMTNLLAAYPDNQFLIRRIFDPVEDIAAAISAPNLSLLFYDGDLLDENEKQNLVSFMNEFLISFEYRWYINTFNHEDLYSLAYWSLLWYVLPLVLTARRILNIKTRDVHPYHIWEYLTSEGFDSYQGYFSREQEMFLYKNTDYVKFNTGKKFLMSVLEGVFLRPIKYSLKALVMAAHTTDRIKYADKVTDALYLKNDVVDYSYAKDMPQLLFELNNDGFDQDDTISHKIDMAGKFKDANTNFLLTKYLEIIKNQNYDSLMILLKFIIDTYVFLLEEGKLNYLIDVNSTLSERNLSGMDPINILNLIHYCVARLANVTPVNTPTMHRTSASINTTSKPDISGSFSVDGITYEISDYVDVDELLDSVPYCDELLSSSAEFSDKAGEQFEAVLGFISILRQTSETRIHTSLSKISRELIPTDYGIVLTQTYATYADMFVGIPELGDFIDDYEQAGTEYFSDLLRTLLDRICPLFRGFAKISEDSENADIVVNKIRELFSYLTSYNVALLQTDTKNQDVYILPQLTCLLTLHHSEYLYVSGNSVLCNGTDYMANVTALGSMMLEDEVGVDASLTDVTSTSLITSQADDPQYSSDITSDRTTYYHDKGNTIDINVHIPEPVSDVIFESNPITPQDLATVGTVLLSAFGIGNHPGDEYEYRFGAQINPGVPGWMVLQDYSTLNTVDWIPTELGVYWLEIRVRNLGGVGEDFDVNKYLQFELV